MLLNSSFTYLELRWVNLYMKQYVVCITLKTTGSRRNQIPHFILPLITRCPALFSRIFYPAFYPLSLPHPALPHSRFLPIACDCRPPEQLSKDWS